MTRPAILHDGPRAAGAPRTRTSGPGTRASAAPPFVAAALLAAILGCDSAWTGMLGAIPTPPVAEDGAVVHVILGMDGLSRPAFDEAQRRGAFAGWQDADLLAVFPASSEYGWARTLHTTPMPGYNVSYYDAADDAVAGDGLLGVAEHALHGGNAAVLPCWRAWDYLGEDELWLTKLYADPEASLRPSMENLFSAIAGMAAAGKTRILAYLPHVDVVGHLHGFRRSLAAVEEIARAIAAFQARHPGRFVFSVLADHGNNHRVAELVDLREVMRQVGVKPVESLASAPVGEPAGIPMIHVRVSYVGVVTRPGDRTTVAQRLSEHGSVDVTATELPTAPGAATRRFALFKQGRAFTFGFDDGDGSVSVDAPQAWRTELQIPLDADGGNDPLRLDATLAMNVTLGGPRPDVFRRVRDAFTPGVVDRPDDVIVSFDDDHASFGFHLPGNDNLATAGFHGNLLAGGSVTVLATQAGSLPAVVRADDAIVVLDDVAAGASIGRP